MKDRSLSVLVIEDAVGDARLIQEFLSEATRATYDTFFAQKLSDGMNALSFGSFDVILLDLSLPDSSGLETLIKLRSHVPEAAIIVLTGLNDEKTAIEAVRTGAQDYLIKGEFDPGLLSRSIQYAVERGHIESRLRQAHKMEAVGTLAGGIAHDFNNILGIISGYTELAMDDISEGTLAMNNLKQVMGACLRAKEVIRQLLIFCRKTEQIREPIQMVPLVRETMKLLRSSIPSTIDIRSCLSEQAGTILADPTQIHQVLINLCTNGAYAMSEKGGVLEVALENVLLAHKDIAERGELSPGRYVRLGVRDTGQGISPEIMRNIFDPYFTTKPAGQGTGMGLGIVQSIVKSHGGDITVTSRPGKGTLFDVYFPAADEAEKDEDDSPSASSKPIPTGKARILLVDDESQILDLESMILERLGYDVTPVSQSAKALETFRARPDDFDLVITDMTMPGMTGIELAREMMDIRLDIPVILCTGFSEKVNAETARSLGFRKYMMKPLSKKELSNTIQDVLHAKSTKGSFQK